MTDAALILGASLIVAFCALVYWPSAILVAGLVLVTCGYLIERGKSRS